MVRYVLRSEGGEESKRRRRLVSVASSAFHHRMPHSAGKSTVATNPRSLRLEVLILVNELTPFPGGREHARYVLWRKAFEPVVGKTELICTGNLTVASEAPLDSTRDIRVRSFPETYAECASANNHLLVPKAAPNRLPFSQALDDDNKSLMLGISPRD